MKNTKKDNNKWDLISNGSAIISIFSIYTYFIGFAYTDFYFSKLNISRYLIDLSFDTTLSYAFNVLNATPIRTTIIIAIMFLLILTRKTSFIFQVEIPSIIFKIAIPVWFLTSFLIFAFLSNEAATKDASEKLAGKNCPVIKFKFNKNKTLGDTGELEGKVFYKIAQTKEKYFVLSLETTEGLKPPVVIEINGSDVNFTYSGQDAKK